MTATSFQIFVLAVLAVELIGEFDLSRAELGIIGSVNTIVGALSAPMSGRLTDRIGPWAAAIAGMTISAIGMSIMAVAGGPLVLGLSALVSGIPQGWGNPATNALIAERVPPGGRGTVTGIKQSGVQFGVFLSGLTLPTLAVWFGWRGAVWVFAAAFAAGAALTALLLPRRVDPLGDILPTDWTARGAAAAAGPATRAGEGTTAASGGDGSQPLTSGAAAGPVMDPWIWRLAGYALLMGTMGGAIGRFFPLWAEESIGVTTTVAGLLVALTGLLGIGARIVAGRVAEDRISPPRLLRILALIGGVYGLILMVTPSVGSWLLWPTTLLNAVGIGAWNAVAMLAIIMVVPKALAGRASGVVMLGFLGGLGLGAPIAGWVVDRWGSYQPVWGACVALTALSALSLMTKPQRPPGASVGSDVDVGADVDTAAGG